MFSFFRTRQCLFHRIACDHLLNDPVITSVSSEKTKPKLQMCFYSHLAPLEGNLLPKNNHMHMACPLPYHNAFLKLLIFVPLGLQKKKHFSHLYCSFVNIHMWYLRKRSSSHTSWEAGKKSVDEIFFFNQKCSLRHIQSASLCFFF